jgi:hypothetical protein
VQQVKLQRNNKGQLLIEMMISITLLLVGIIGLFTLLTKSFSLQYSFSSQYTATYLASEGVELVRHIADTNTVSGKAAWRDGLEEGSFGITFEDPTLDSSAATDVLQFDEKNGVYTYGLGMRATPFRRTITIGYISDDEVRVSSRVYWTGKEGKVQEVVIEDHFFNWR